MAANKLIGIPSAAPPGSSRAFCNLIKAIGDSGSNHEEDRIIRAEVRLLQEKLREPNIHPRQMKEYLVRLIYCEMLGHEVSFGYIHAVKFTQLTSLMEKRVGYLAASLLLHENHEIMLLLINTIQRDLKSTNVAEISVALTTICKLINADMIPAVLHLVEDKLTHPREVIRKKAILALHRFYTRSPSSVSHLGDIFRRALCDQDPGVVASSLHIFYEISLTDATSYKDLTPSFVNLLKQIIENRLPRDFDYHRIPAPWVQIKILKILALLGADDQSASESMYEVIRDCLRRCDPSSAASSAVLFECVTTITTIYPSSQLVEAAAKAVGKYLHSSSNNMKYLGITALASVVKVNPVYANEHQMVVIDCLSDSDETIKRKTLDLLCRMTNPANVTVIIEKLLSYLSSTVDPYLRSDLVPRITSLAERFAPDNLWYVETMNSLFDIAGDLVAPAVAHNLLRLIAEGSDDEEADKELRLFAVESYIELLEKPQLPDILVQTMAWVIGEYLYLSQDYEYTLVIEMLTSLLSRSYQNEVETKGWVLVGIAKIVAQTGIFPSFARAAFDKLLHSESLDLQQRCREILRLAETPQLMKRAYPVDSSCDDMELDPNLNFLAGFVQASLQRGGKPYSPPEQRVVQPVEESRPRPAFNFEPYQMPSEPRHHPAPTPVPSVPSVPATPSLLADLPGVPHVAPAVHEEPALPLTATPSGPPEPSLSLQVSQKRWGKGGDLAKQVAKPAPPPTEQGSFSALPTPETLPSTSAPQPSVTPAPTIPVPEPAKPLFAEPPKQEIDPKKQELASALFASTTANQASRTRVSRARKTNANEGPSLLGGPTTAPSTHTQSSNLLGDLMDIRPAPGPVTLPKSSGANSLIDDFLGLGASDSNNATTTSTTIPNTVPASSNSLLGDFLPMTSSAPLVPTSTTMSSGPSQKPYSLNDDLLGGGLLSLSTPTPISSHLQTSSSPMIDLLGGSPLTSTLIPSSSLLPQTISNNLFTSESEDKLHPALEVIPHTNSDAEVTSDPHIAVSYTKVWKQDALVLAVFVRNKTDRLLSGVVTRLMIPPEFQKIPFIGVSESLQDTFTDNLSPRQTKQHIVSLSCKAIASGVSLRGHVTYTDLHLNAGNAYFNVSLVASDFLRPLEITTEDFGRLWEANPAERKQRFNSPVKTPDELVALLVSRLHIHPVQIIGMEVILAGRVLVFSNELCLVHAQLVGSQQMDLTVHSPRLPYSEAIIRNCNAVFN